MKKISIALILLLVINLIAVPALAAQSAHISVYASTSTVTRGQTFTVTVSTSAIENCISGGVFFEYDTNVFETVGGKAMPSLSGFTAGIYNQNGKLAGYFMNSNATVQGDIFQVTLKVKDNAAFGTYNIYGEGSANDTSGTVSCNTGSASVSVVCNHSWSNWTGTQPTCGAAGSLTRTCNICNATESDTPAATGNHNYGAWTKNDKENHKHTCGTCGNVETAGHSWNSGVTTTPATCKDTGVKTYTCTVCSETKTEDVPKTTTHKYGNWTKIDDNQHKHICEVCSKEETANHTWNSGVITKDPTCNEKGVKTYTCSDCNATKAEDVPKTTTHTYGAWTKLNDNQHEHTCSVCQVKEQANHSWNDGEITKDPTCKEMGVKTFTCSDCNATKTEDVPKTTTHKYGNWTNVDDNQHKHICEVCSKEETASHTWNSGVITKKPTCKEEGVKTFTCTGCSATKTEDLEKLTTHTYDHDCDTDCNVCGVTRETTHKYKTTWSKDKNEHWHECSVCKDKQDIAAHTPGAAATEYKAQTCTTCGYVIKAALGHKHKYATTWTTDEKGHWYTCSGCEEKGSYADHDFENDCDADCSVCGYTREIEHAFDEKWTTDETNHWHVCASCGLKQDEAAHEPGAEATATTAQTCTICQYEIAPALGVPETTEAPTEAPTTEPEVPAVEKNGNGENPFIIIAAITVIAAVVIALIVLITRRKKEKEILN